MVAASLSHQRISLASSMLAECSTDQGGRGFSKNEDKSPPHPVWGLVAVRIDAAPWASHGRSGSAPPIVNGRGWVCGPHPSRGILASALASGERLVSQHRLQCQAQSEPTMRASHAVMELRPMIHRGNSAPQRCPEKPSGRSR